MRYSVNVATNNMEFRMSSQAIHDDDDDARSSNSHREICLYLFMFSGFASKIKYYNNL